MEDIELKNIWQSYDRKIAEAQVLNAQSWVLNLRCFETIQQQKAASKLNALARYNVFAIILGIIWVLFLGILVWGNRFTNFYFSFSVSMILLFSLYAVIIYLKHTILINRINYDGSILDTQKKLASLQASTFRSIRIIWLQMPFHTTWWWHSSWAFSNDLKFWFISLPITLLFTLLTIYLYRNIRIENMDKKWVRALMMAGPEYKNVASSLAFLNEIEEFKKELI